MLEFIAKVEGEFANKQNPFQLAFFNLHQSLKLRELKPNIIGRLTSFSATVTRTTEVKPELNMGTFQCIQCGHIHDDVAQQFKYTTPVKCNGNNCMATGMSSFQLIYKKSTFMDW